MNWRRRKSRQIKQGKCNFYLKGSVLGRMYWDYKVRAMEISISANSLHSSYKITLYSDVILLTIFMFKIHSFLKTVVVDS